MLLSPSPTLVFNGGAVGDPCTPVVGDPCTPVGTLGGTNYCCSNKRVTDGVHRIMGDVQFGLIATVFSIYASYGYVAGLGLQTLNAGCVTGGFYHLVLWCHTNNATRWHSVLQGGNTVDRRMVDPMIFRRFQRRERPSRLWYLRYLHGGDLWRCWSGAVL